MKTIAVKTSKRVIRPKDHHDMINRRIQAIATWNDIYRNSDWTIVSSKGSLPGAEQLRSKTIEDGLLYQKLLNAFEMPKSRWRKTAELIKRYERAKGISFWPDDAPTDISALAPMFEWMIARPARLIAYDTIFQQENGGESIFDRHMRSLPSERPDGPIDPVERIMTAIMSYGCTLTIFVRAIIDGVFPPNDQGPSTDDAVGQWIAKNIADLATPQAPFPKLDRRGRPTNAERAARELARLQSMQDQQVASTQIGDGDGDHETDVPAEQTEVTNVLSADQIDEHEAIVESDEMTDVQTTADAPQVDEHNNLPPSDIEADDLEIAEIEREIQERADALDRAKERLRLARMPVDTNPLKTELDEAWPENGVEWPSMLPKASYAKILAPHRIAVTTSTSIAAIDAALAAAGAKLAAEPGSLDDVIAQLIAAREQRAQLIAERHAAADQVQSIAASAQANLIETPLAAEAVDPSLDDAPEDDPRDLKIAELSARIAELERIAESAQAMIRAKDESISPEGHARHTIATISLTSLEGSKAKRNKAQKIVTEWSAAVAKAPHAAIEAIAGGGETRVGDHEIRIVATSDGTQWAIRHTHPDESRSDRTWTVEAALSLRDGRLELFAQVFLTGDKSGELTRTRPRFIKALVDLGGWIDGSLPVSQTVKRIDSLSAFQSMVLSPGRRLPFVVISTTNATKQHLTDEDYLASRLDGVAHVAIMSEAAGRHVSEAYENRWSVYDGAIRIYKPLTDPNASDPSKHRYIPAPLIAKTTSRALAEQILKSVLQISTTTPHTSDSIDFASVQKAHVASVQDAVLSKPVESQTGEELRELAAMRDKQVEDAHSEIKALYEIVSEETNLKLKAYEERDQSILAAESAQREADEMRHHVEALRAVIAKMSERGIGPGKTSGTNAGGDETIAPEQVVTHADLLKYVETGLGPHIVAIPKCLRDLEKKTTVNIEKTMDALALLRDYVAMRQKRIDHATWSAIRKSSRAVDCTYGGNTGVLKAFGEYEFTYEGRKFVAERHIKIGGNPDLRDTVRIYYTYDEETDRALILRMTEHLKVESTN